MIPVWSTIWKAKSDKSETWLCFNDKTGQGELFIKKTYSRSGSSILQSIEVDKDSLITLIKNVESALVKHRFPKLSKKLTK